LSNSVTCTASGSVLTWKWIAGVWALVTLAVLGFMFFVMASVREVNQYSTLVFEQSAREALNAYNYSRAARICSGALRTGISQRNDYWGLAYLLRAEAEDGEDRPLPALSDLQASARLWGRKYYDYPSREQRQEAAKFGAELGLRLVESGDIPAARHAMSAAGICSGSPAAYLYEQNAKIAAGIKSSLWSEGPAVSLIEFKDFEGPKHAWWTAHEAEDLLAPNFVCWVEDQGRTLQRSAIDATGSRDGGPCATFEVSPSTRNGRSYYCAKVHVPLYPKPFGVRIRAKSEVPSGFGVFLDFWFDRSKKSAPVPYTDGKDLGDGWREFDIYRDFYSERKAEAEKNGYDSTDGIISNIGLTLEPGPANRFWVDKLDLYITDAPR